jgi:hypothetical protein
MGLGAMSKKLSDEDMGPDYDEEVDEADSEDEGYTAAGQEVINAVNDGDANAVAKALRGLVARAMADKS